MPTVIEGISPANSINNDETFGRVAPLIRVPRGRDVTQAMERAAPNGQEDRMKTYSISVIPGDGVGVDVIAEGLRVLRRAGEVTGSYTIETTVYPWSCHWYLEHGAMMPEDGLDRLRDSDSIYLGAVGFPGVPDHVSLWGLLLPIRFGFDQYVNLRPIQLLDGIEGPLRGRTAADIDILCIRENSEGEYTDVGGRFHVGLEDEVALQTAVFTRKGIERIARYAFERARERRKRLASATKSNALKYSAVLWDEVVAEVAQDYPDVALSKYHVDALAARFITAPDTLDVVVGSNLFGDILTDLGGALQGSLGLPAGANHPGRRARSASRWPAHTSAGRHLSARSPRPVRHPPGASAL